MGGHDSSKCTDKALKVKELGEILVRSIFVLRSIIIMVVGQVRSVTYRTSTAWHRGGVLGYRYPALERRSVFTEQTAIGSEFQVSVMDVHCVSTLIWVR